MRRSPTQPVRRLCGLALGAAAAVALSSCGGGGATAASYTHATGSPAAPVAKRHTVVKRARPRAITKPAAKPRPAVPQPIRRPAPKPFPRLLPAAQATQPTPFVPVAQWNGRTAAWEARSASGVALLSFNQNLVALHLHSGTTDAGPTGWRYGPSIAGFEARHVIAAFNGGFKFATGAGGFMSSGRVALPLRAGLGSVVTYANGTTDIGSWGSEVPAHSHSIASVRQNLTLLIDHGTVATSTGCLNCWGATLGGVSDPARSALGVTADGRLIWAGGEHLTVAALAQTLVSAHVIRAVELDINPAWVNGYLYGHRGGRGPLAPVPVVPGQNGISGEYLSPWSRDFFTVVAR